MVGQTIDKEDLIVEGEYQEIKDNGGQNNE